MDVMVKAKPILFVQVAAVCATLAFGAFAATNHAQADEDDQDRARRAMLMGEVEPLAKLLSRVEETYQGDIIEVELEEEDDEGGMYDGEWRTLLLYEIKLLTPQGNLVKLEYDARTLDLLSVDGHDSERARRKKYKDRKDEED